MGNNVFPTRTRVRVTHYGPYRGLEGTIRFVDELVDDLAEPYCFYLIALEGASLPQPVWFESQEVELIDAPTVLSPLPDLSGVVLARE